jgi:bifunctional DNA-binding transcriptional regulator/antitoxin component of YhaV-PrlF toxin-antitoxin module
MNTTNKSWTLDVQEDPETGDGILEFPPELLEAAGWKEGDTLTWTDMGNGSWSLSKKEDKPNESTD